MTPLFPPGSLVFDIGAHLGESTKRFLEAGAGGVVAVEACLENHLVLHSQHRNDGRVIALHAAALDAPGFAEIHRSVDQTGLSTLDPDRWQRLYPAARFAKGEMVTAITLDMLVERFGEPAFVKVDVEGLELRVLRGLSRKVNALAFEFHGADAEQAMDCLSLLELQGYTLAALMEGDVDLSIRPLTALHALRDAVARTPPAWGNIMVM